MRKARLKPEILEKLQDHETCQLEIAQINAIGNKDSIKLSTVKRWIRENAVYLTFVHNLELMKKHLGIVAPYQEMVEFYETEESGVEL